MLKKLYLTNDVVGRIFFDKRRCEFKYIHCITVHAFQGALSIIDLDLKLCTGKYIYIVLSILKLIAFVTE